MNIRILPPARRALTREGTGIPGALNAVPLGRLGLRKLRDRQSVLAIFIVAVVYAVCAKLGLSLAFTTKQVTAFWPPTGIALAALLLAGYRVWPGIFIGAFVANLTSAEPWFTAAGISIGNVLAAICGAYLLRNRFRFHITLERTRDVSSLVIAAALSTLLSSTLGTLNLTVANLVAWVDFGSVWWVWWVGDTLGILLVAPFLLTWAVRPRIEWRGFKLAEYWTLLLALTIVSCAVFLRQVPAGQPLALMAYATFPFLLWAAFRFETRDIVACMLIVITIAVSGAVHERGPFAFGGLDERLISLDSFVGIIGITALLLGAVTAERRRSQERLRRARNELERRVTERTAQLERANGELYEFSYSMSHDLRAPLRAVNAFSELLSVNHAPTLDAEGQRLVRNIAKNSRQMARMIDDYLKLFRLRGETLAREVVDVESQVREVVGEIGAQYPQSNARFDIRALTPTMGDPGLLRQVFVNLIDNAVKFSSRNQRPCVEIGCRDERDQTVYYVRDNGVGFDMQWAGQLFKVFQRLHPRDFEGLGMGLAIVASIVERHGGTASAEGEVNRGATFYVALPKLVS